MTRPVWPVVAGLALAVVWFGVVTALLILAR